MKKDARQLYLEVVEEVTIAGKKLRRRYDHRFGEVFDSMSLRGETKRWVGWTKFPPDLRGLPKGSAARLAMERQQRALLGCTNEFYKDIVLHRGNLPNTMKYTITKEIEDKFGRAKVVQYFENLLPDPAVRRNSKLLAKFGGDNVEARRAYDEAVRAIRGKLGNAFEFVDLEKLEDMAP